MRNVLIVSPHFPPVNAPDMQRVRLSLPHLAAFGWKATVLAVDPAYVEAPADPLLLETIPRDTAVCRTRALAPAVTRMVGLGDLGLRAFAFLARAGNRLLGGEAIDLVYFSTTVFTAVALGRIWKERYGVPFVVDMQDAWVTDYYRDHPDVPRPPKFWVADRLHRMLEPWTMREAGGVLAVSGAYIETLQRRYPELGDVPTRTLPFGASEDDFELVRTHPQANPFFTPGDGHLHGVYVGRGGEDMTPSVTALFGALAEGRLRARESFSRVRLHFIGTSYAPDCRARKTIEPVAERMGVGGQVCEHTSRVPYFQALQLLRDADFLVVPGSDDPQYSASKIYPYILARKPLVALFRGTSDVCDVVRRTNAGRLVTITDDADGNQAEAFAALAAILDRPAAVPDANWDAFAPYLSREMTRRQCELFDDVLGRSWLRSAA